jgi:hypothetical protein
MREIVAWGGPAHRHPCLLGTLPSEPSLPNPSLPASPPPDGREGLKGEGVLLFSLFSR